MVSLHSQSSHRPLTYVAFLFHLAVTGLFIVQSKPKNTRPEVKRLVIEDGLGIFLIVTVVYLVQAVVTCIWLNDLVNVAFLPLALTIITIGQWSVHLKEYHLTLPQLSPDPMFTEFAKLRHPGNSRDEQSQLFAHQQSSAHHHQVGEGLRQQP
jgi:hypothetical protein